MNKVTFPPFLLLLTLALLALATGCNDQPKTPANGGAKALYTCGMHPQVVQDHPGNCPICGMKLTPIKKQTDASGAPVAADDSTIIIDPATTQNMGLRTGLVTKGPLHRVVRTVATIDFDETALADVTTKFKGWIEKLYVDATGRQVHRGEPLFEIYSPDLYSAQVEYIISLTQSGKMEHTSELMMNSALTKLKFFDISDAQIAELEKTRQPTKTLRVNASRDGIVVEKMAVEGQMADAGMKLYRLADLSMVWVQAQVYEQDLAFISLGQEALVKLSYFPDREFRGRVTYIYPTVDEKTRTAKVRMEVHNPGFFLKPGMYATVQLHAELVDSAILVPDTAVLRSGDVNTAFVALDHGRFEARTLKLGPRSDNNEYQVYSGLSEGERVVTSGQFMLDSESQLREAIQKMGQPGVDPLVLAKSKEATFPRAPGGKTVPHEEATYLCPMPEHVAIKYNHPGKCPICGMTLVPVSEASLKQIQPGGKLLYYTCPMPEHAEVHAAGPGKCPQCSMTLIPVLGAIPAPAMVATNSLKLFTCPMESHADVVSDQPGKCPKCEMKLVPTTSVDHGKKAEENWHKQHPVAMPAMDAPKA